MSEPSAPYHRGEMDIDEQKATYEGFLNLSKWGSLALAAGLVFLILWFCTKAGFLMGLIAGVIVLAIGVFVLREPKGGASGH
jgi:Na+/proline symporter